MKRLVITALMALVAMTAQAQDDPADGTGTYRVSLEVSRGGDFLGAPFLIMVEGKREQITLKDGPATIVLEPLIDANTASASVDTIVTIGTQTWRPVIGVAFGTQKSFLVEQLSVKVKIIPVGNNES
ncbi:MAG: hypothetical protein AAFS02_16490 [Pseudomonadota bacterium]